jgi:hypothetical protein
VLAANTLSLARKTTNVYTCETSSDITGNLWETALEFQWEKFLTKQILIRNGYGYFLGDFFPHPACAVRNKT